MAEAQTENVQSQEEDTEAEWQDQTIKAHRTWNRQTRDAHEEWGIKPEARAFTVTKPDMTTLRVVKDVTQETPAKQIVEMLDIKPDSYDSCVFIMGGASGMSEEQKIATANTLENILSKALINKRVLVGDGGTDSGAMGMVNDIFKKIPSRIQGSDHYLGISPQEYTSHPDWEGIEGQETVPIGSEHTHVVTVATPGKIGKYDNWGKETNKMYEVFELLAEGKEALGIMINGGNITIDELFKNIIKQRNVTVLNGTGRAADVVCKLFNGETQFEEKEQSFVDRFKQNLNTYGITDDSWKSSITIVNI